MMRDVSKQPGGKQRLLTNATQITVSPFEQAVVTNNVAHSPPQLSKRARCASDVERKAMSDGNVLSHTLEDTAMPLEAVVLNPGANHLADKFDDVNDSLQVTAGDECADVGVCDDVLHNYAEMNDLTSSYPVCDLVGVTGDRLKAAISEWERMGASKFVLSVLENGYSLPFVCLPNRKILVNHSSCKSHAEFVNEAVSELVSSSAVTEVNEEEVSFSSPLGVVEGKKLRLILDLRVVNKCLSLKKV